MRMRISTQQQKVSLKQLKEIFSIVPLGKWNWFFLVLFILSMAGIGSLISWYIGYLVGTFFNSENFKPAWETRMHFYFLLVVILFAFYVFEKVISIFNNLMLASAFNRYAKNMRDMLYLKFQNLPMNFFENEKTGDLMAAIVNDTENLSNALSSIVSNILSVIFTFVLNATLMFIYAPLLGLISIILVPLTGAIFIYITSKTKKYFRKAQDAFGEYNGYIEEILDALPNVRIHQKQDLVYKKFEKVSLNERNAGRKSVLFWHILFPSYNFINILNQLIIVSLSTYFFLNQIPTYGIKPLDFGIITSFSMYIASLTNQIMTVISFSNTLQNGLASWDRIKRILEAPDNTYQNKLGKLAFQKGEIKFENVNFHYPNVPDKLILDNINFNIPAQTSLALVGHTGSGKTTISKLLAKFYEPTSGKITIDKQDSQTISEKSWRDSIAIISQDTFLFEDTIWNNLKMVNEHLSDEKILEICKITQIDSFIQKMPEKYNTMLVNNGRNISEGQRQLLAITRALISERPIIIMDEATSNIDTITENLIQESFKYLNDQKTVVIIAHRLSTIINSDQILLLENGKIVERGNHKELMQNKEGKYFKLYNSILESDKQILE
ncbi:ABC transporter ATP-binding protein [Mycoplasmopsis glycophila]|uniref:ABC-type multidrug/protein/lipid transport system ATPase component n=1 Tax=Mycoplasmopsis glycophila TaxID=171285 RepID=A0A449AWH8_9BACT|nr:ABC transporter ATP-binding protein [Mycoplasmopsis glycophila]VEU71017.1 ABC-type multidrug/protein/lipid transport system ATPase component [Mycoplasmopsis glycophila]